MELDQNQDANLEQSHNITNPLIYAEYKRETYKKPALTWTCNVQK